MGAAPTTPPLPARPSTGPPPSRAYPMAQGAVVAFVVACALAGIALLVGLTQVSDTPDDGALSAARLLILIGLIMAAASLAIGASVAAWVLLRYRDDPAEADATRLARRALLVSATVLLLSPVGLPLLLGQLAALLQG